MTEWDYLCPVEGGHLFDPHELHLAICHDDGTHQVVAVFPSNPVRGEPGYDQPEAVVKICRDALAEADLSDLSSWLAAHGSDIRYPDPE